MKRSVYLLISICSIGLALFCNNDSYRKAQNLIKKGYLYSPAGYAKQYLKKIDFRGDTVLPREKRFYVLFAHIALFYTYVERKELNKLDTLFQKLKENKNFDYYIYALMAGIYKDFDNTQKSKKFEQEFLKSLPRVIKSFRKKYFNQKIKKPKIIQKHRNSIDKRIKELKQLAQQKNRSKNNIEFEIDALEYERWMTNIRDKKNCFKITFKIAEFKKVEQLSRKQILYSPRYYLKEALKTVKKNEEKKRINSLLEKSKHLRKKK